MCAYVCVCVCFGKFCLSVCETYCVNGARVQVQQPHKVSSQPEGTGRNQYEWILATSHPYFGLNCGAEATPGQTSYIGRVPATQYML